MSEQAKAFVHYRSGVIWFALFCAMGGAIVFAALQLSRQEAQSSRQAQAARQDIRGKLARANQEEAEIRQKIGHFRMLEEKGYIGQEQRLEWVEQIATIKNRRRLIDLQYELAPQRPLEATLLPTGSLAGKHEFMASTMKLQMQLLHEDDLLGFLSDLTRSVQAMIHLRECKIERIAAPIRPERGPVPQLGANCVLEWITIREKKS